MKEVLLVRDVQLVVMKKHLANNQESFAELRPAVSQEALHLGSLVDSQFSTMLDTVASMTPCRQPQCDTRFDEQPQLSDACSNFLLQIAAASRRHSLIVADCCFVESLRSWLDTPRHYGSSRLGALCRGIIAIIFCTFAHV
jgi:hypothetical protein